MKRVLTGAVLLLLMAVRPVQHPVSAASAPIANRAMLHVGLWTLWHDRAVQVSPAQLTPAGVARKITLRTCTRCAGLTFTQPFAVRAEGDKINFSETGRSESTNRLQLAGPVTLSAHGESVTLNDPVFISAHAGVLVLAVELPLEDYVERVVASESSAADSAESLKALAIVVRSFALHEAHGHTEYDLCDSTHCQLLHWGGNPGRYAAAHAATLATAGETLWFHGTRALAYFGKDCGGHTASSDEIWPAAHSAAYLPSRPDTYCTREGGREWASEATHAELTAALAAHGVARPGWKNLTVARRGESGRALTLHLDAVEISAEQFRLGVGESLGWDRIPSTWFEVSRQGDRFEFHGRGWGNGVGLCQKGAAEMAAEGRLTKDILDEYFPGAGAADEDSGRAWRSFAGKGFVFESLEPADEEFLPELASARAEASERSGLNAAQSFTVRGFASTPQFRAVTQAPGWVAAFIEGDWIGTQPLRTLAARHLLAATMRHEFLHALVEREAGPAAPLWLREGLVETWGADSGAARSNNAPTAESLSAVNAALAHASTEAESESAHRAAGAIAGQLLARYGRGQVMEWLRSGIPANVVAALGQR